MEFFEFCSPTKFYLGSDAEGKVVDYLEEKIETVLIVHSGDSFLYSSGLFDRVVRTIEASGKRCINLSGILPNPTLEKVYEGARLCRKEKVDFILSLGGGSVVDTAKAIGIGALYSGDVWDFYQGKKVVNETIPVGTIMTVASTGSEGSNGSVITNTETGEKRDVMTDLIRPVFCLMNPEITFSVPKFQTALGICDMFSHITERYFTNSKGVVLVDYLCEGAMTAVIEMGAVAMKNGKDYDARANLMWTSVLAHNGLLGTGRNQDWATHMMGAPISGQYNSIHGATISVLLPYWMEYVMAANIPMFARFANKVFGTPIENDNLEQVAKEGIASLRHFFNEMGLPSRLRDIGVGDKALFEKMAEMACGNGTIGCVKSLSVSDVINIYEMAY